ncbi:hypothetical protein [Polyangium sp. 15x6]|uniref:hypothetical protein n=1 Tax=Polyangium sp. 15x6 TaxID=3042687 RepID=UPI00249BF566|nr:hypothetical protein [Polyangium sp. 15x6]MDI3290420.1 hypothetical protein [Polyangium sp. 15x6]
MKRAGQITIFVLCVLFSVSAAVNVMADNSEVERAAAAVACGEQGPNCRAQVTRLERTPFGQTFEMVTPKRTVDVVCRRAFVMVGEHACKLR